MNKQNVGKIAVKFMLVSAIMIAVSLIALIINFAIGAHIAAKESEPYLEQHQTLKEYFGLQEIESDLEREIPKMFKGDLAYIKNQAGYYEGRRIEIASALADFKAQHPELETLKDEYRAMRDNCSPFPMWVILSLVVGTVCSTISLITAGHIHDFCTKEVKPQSENQSE